MKVLIRTALCCCALATAAALTPVEAARSTTRRVSRPAPGLYAGAPVDIDLPRQVGADLAVDLPIGRLELCRKTVRSSEYRVLVEGADGETREVEPGPVRTYCGTVAGVPDSVVAAHVGPDGLHARILMPGDEILWVQPNRRPGALRQHVIYRDRDVMPTIRTCNALAPTGQGEGGNEAAGGQAAAGAPGTLHVAQIAIDADYEYFQAWGSVSAVEDRVNSVINAINLQYERDVEITHEITTIIVRTTNDDPYTSSGANALLTEMRNHWNDNHADVERDVAHLFTGKDLTGSTVGVAFLNVVCIGYSAYGLSQSDFSTNFASVTDLTAHELGHNWGAGHCSCSNPDYTMNPSLQAANLFSPDITVPAITEFRDSRTCLEEIEPGPDPVDPADINGDGVVDMYDVVEVVLGWGDCPPGPPAACPADVNGDGAVGVDDIVAVIVAMP